MTLDDVKMPGQDDDMGNAAAEEAGKDDSGDATTEEM